MIHYEILDLELLVWTSSPRPRTCPASLISYCRTPRLTIEMGLGLHLVCPGSRAIVCQSTVREKGKPQDLLETTGPANLARAGFLGPHRLDVGGSRSFSPILRCPYLYNETKKVVPN
jgi:hypothetical protein